MSGRNSQRRAAITDKILCPDGFVVLQISMFIFGKPEYDKLTYSGYFIGIREKLARKILC
ncbi:MAG: hypothetical protein WBI55_05360 [Eubacteriales bacterium]|jgi:hypothetical protein